MKLLQISSAEKILPDVDYSGLKEINTLTSLKGERVSYQILYLNEGGKRFKVSVKDAHGMNVIIRKVGNVQVDFPGHKKEMDDYYLKKTPGIYPDYLEPIEDGMILANDYNHVIYITSEVPENIESGKYKLQIMFDAEADDEHLVKEIEVNVLNAVLPETDFTYTQWFHSDCIASVYKYELMSDEHWLMIEKFVKTAVRTGVNMILTPVFTPALDTAIGHERPTFQLVGVSYIDGKYSFDFRNLKKWIDMCLRCGIKKFEISHLFTQWGARKTPKIIVNGERKFGWDVDADSKMYLEFLDEFLPALTDFLKSEMVYENSYFHISDEPNFERDFEHYKKCYDFIVKYIPAEKLTDAMSEYEFIERGYAKNPIVKSESVEDFFNRDMRDIWTYTCCEPAGGFYSNRFITMPLGRTRILGIQLYKYGIKGFLHWGYNFYYTAGSKKVIDPFRVTDGGEQFPAGDSFSVYPGADGPLESIRSEAFYQGLQDRGACCLLESLIGREETLKVIDADGKITMSEYPRSNDGILGIRERINLKIEEVVK